MVKQIVRVLKVKKRTTVKESVARPEYIRRAACDVLTTENAALLGMVNIYYTANLASHQYREFTEVFGGFRLYRDSNDAHGVFCPRDGVLTIRKRPEYASALVAAQAAA